MADHNVPDPTDVVVEFHGEAPASLADLAAAHPEDLTLLQAKGFGAPDFTVQALFGAAATAVLRSITVIVRAHIAANQHVTIKVDGVEIHGLGVDDAVRVLEELDERSTAGDEGRP